MAASESRSTEPPLQHGSSLLHRQAAKALLRPRNESGLGRADRPAQSATDSVAAGCANRQAGADTQCRRLSFVGWSLRICFSFKAGQWVARCTPIVTGLVLSSIVFATVSTQAQVSIDVSKITCDEYVHGKIPTTDFISFSAVGSLSLEARSM